MSDKILKKRKGYLAILVIIMVFVFLIISADFLIYFSEYKINPQIETLDDSFRAIETVFSLKGDQGVYPMTTIGRVTTLFVFIFSIILLIIFAAQVFTLLNHSNFKKWGKKINKEQDELMDEIEETQELEQDVLSKQKQILEYEKDILKRLDELRKDS